MTVAKLLQPSFAGGEMDPALHGRVDLQRYGLSLKTAKNVIVRATGGIEARGGSIYVGTVKFPTKITTLIPFEVSSTVAYVVELGDFYARFWSNNVMIHEIVTPWSETQVDAVRLTQSADILFLVHDLYPPRQIGRITATTFTIATFNYKAGPFRALNADEARVMSSSAANGTTVITANFDIFVSTMVGSLIRLEQKALGVVKPWVQGDRSIVLDTQRRSEGKVYRAVTVPAPPAGTGNFTETGNVRPLHDFGRNWDGPGDTRSINGGVSWVVGIEWEYMHSGYGVAKITAFTNARTVTATITKAMPAGVVGGVGAAALTWNLVGDGTTKVFAVAGATESSQSNYSVTISAAPVQQDPNYVPPGTGTGTGPDGGNWRDPGDGYYIP